MAKLLIVEDDIDLAERLAEWLRFEKHTVDIATLAMQGLELVQTYAYEVIILDWHLPDISGLEFCARYRASGGTVPILMLTSRSAVQDKTDGLDSGADDYVTKPFVVQELSARVRALLRRSSHLSESKLSAGEIVLDTNSRQVFRRGEEVRLLPKEFALLEFLLRNPNKVFATNELLNNVWSSDAECGPDTVYTYIKTLRKKIDSDSGPSLIHTVRGVGYRLTPY